LYWYVLTYYILVLRSLCAGIWVYVFYVGHVDKIMKCNLKRALSSSSTAQHEDSDKPKGSIQWVPAETSIDIEVRVYNYLFTTEEPSDIGWEGELNPESEITYSKAKVDPSILF
jgi:hypothetical protein